MRLSHPLLCVFVHFSQVAGGLSGSAAQTCAVSSVQGVVSGWVSLCAVPVVAERCPSPPRGVARSTLPTWLLPFRVSCGFLGLPLCLFFPAFSPFLSEISSTSETPRLLNTLRVLGGCCLRWSFAGINPKSGIPVHLWRPTCVSVFCLFLQRDPRLASELILGGRFSHPHTQLPHGSP